MSAEVVVRRARTPDVRAIRSLVEPMARSRRIVSKDAVAYYEAVHEFRVVEVDREVVGCGALHVMWEDLAEVRTVAVRPEFKGRGLGSALLDAARELGVRRVFVLTFETAFFASFGFVPILGTPVPPDVFEELLRSYDEGVAEFLDLERVKPNTLGNTRMLLHL